MRCPFRNFEECPEHNKQNGCSFWIAYSSNREGLDAHMEGCAITLTPILLLENANYLGVVAGEVNKMGAEISAGRNEAIQTGVALRTQLITLACGERKFVDADYSSTMKLETQRTSK